MKIRTAIFGVYVAASALGFAILMAFILSDVRPRYIEAMRRALADTAALLAASVDGAATADSAGGDPWRGRLGNLGSAAGVLQVDVTDAQGMVVDDSNGGRDTGLDFAAQPALAPFFGGAGSAAAGAVGGDGMLRVAAPWRRGGAIAGYVVVGRPLNSVAGEVWTARVRLALGALAIAAAMTLAGWWIAHKLTHSLERLATYARAVGAGQLARPPVSRATEIAALAEAFEQMRAALEGKAYVERYTQALTHELKAPLSVIRGSAELLQESMPPEDRARFLGHLRVESNRIQQIVDRMLQLSALEARRGLEATAPLDLAALARDAAEALRPAWQTRGLAVHVAAAAPAPVRGEKFLLVQALTNLLQNAIEFTPSGGVIAVRVEAAGGAARVWIEDSGPGVPDFALGRIFERFYSLPRPDTGRKSTGLGLSFVREIALLHGGEIAVNNRPEGGARAMLQVPAA